MKNYMSEVLFLKWSPNVKEQFYEKSKLKDKHKAIGNNVMETTLQEGYDFNNNNNINNSNKIREHQFEKMNQREMVAQTSLNPFLSSNYLEDLHFSFNLTQKKFKHLVIAKATVSNPNLVSRNDLNFGFIEILNRYKFVETYKLNKINFYITAFIRMLYLITNILHLKTSWILRFFGNLKGIISCIILDINKKIN